MNIARSFLLLPRRFIMKQTRVRVVDNSIPTTTSAEEAPYCIHVYGKKKRAGLGDLIKIAYKGKLHKAVVVSGSRNKRFRYDNQHNVVVVDDNINPIGSRIVGPIPLELKRHEKRLSKVLAIATKFI